MSFRFLNEGQRGNVQEFTPIDTFIDPVSKIRVSNPSNLIDTDFEYGLQPTKWETVELINNTPAFFSKSGDTTISDITGITTNSGTREVTITTAFPHNLAVGIPIRVSGTKSVTADGSYIINATPTDTTFTYLARANQEQTISIFDLYTSVITGEFFQGSQISIDDAEGIVTNSVGPTSTLTVKTPTKHGFGLNTPFYFLNLNSTISQEFESQNSASLSFDPSNSATAQTFDGSNTLLQTPIDLSNSATTSNFQSIITSTNPIAATVTVGLSGEDWSVLKIGSPVYHSVSVGGGYFQENPRGVVFIKNVDQINQSGGTATFQVSQLPDGPAIPILANMTGFFQIANQARTFAGNNVNPETQIDLEVEVGQEFLFDGGNQGYEGSPESPPSNTATVAGYTGTSMTVFTPEGSLEYYQGAMLKYNATETAATGLVNNATYFVTSFAPGQSSGLFSMSIAEFPNENPISISGGSGVQTFSKIGVAVDKNIVHIKNSAFEERDMLEYTYPENETSGNFGADFEKRFYFVNKAFDTHNYLLSEDVGFRQMVATGGNSITEIYSGGRAWKVHQFTSTGTSNFVVSNSGTENGEVEHLIIAGGGGGGGGRHGSGGGAGGYLSSVPGESSGANSPAQGKVSLNVGSYPVVVGAGGAGGPTTSVRNGSDGQNSSFAGIVAIGGGGGGSSSPGQGRAGGSGGGSSRSGSPVGGAGTAGQGRNGGGGAGNGPGSGGGGASQVGGVGDDTTPGGKGGDGILSSITGTSIRRGGGGGGGGAPYRSPGTPGAGGLGGGGAGTSFGTPGVNGSPNTGGGGGGQGGDVVAPNENGAPGGSGGSGVVFIRYPITPEPTGQFIVASGGQISLAQEDGIRYAVHTFTQVGSSTFNISSVGNPTNNFVQYLVVAGGGGGGQVNGDNGGGGGAGGGVLAGSIVPSVGNISVVVGAGGIRLSSATTEAQARGGSSSFASITATGGGFGGGYLNFDQQGTVNARFTGGSGGSSGGGSVNQNAVLPSPTGQGFRGGFGINGYGGAGGGGGSSVGQDGQGTTSTSRAGNGGDGFLSSITGSSVRYAGGGGGGGNTGRQSGTDLAGSGGAGGGGRGASHLINSSAGLSNTGGGGGAGGGGQSGGTERVASNGGSGIVIVRYQIGFVN